MFARIKTRLNFRSEFGQRALGHRSILSDPRAAALRLVINQQVKQREWFRPLAPAVMDEHVSEWFEDTDGRENLSPFMSVTASVRPEKRAEVPAICHTDGSARLQTVTEAENSLFHALLRRFKSLTGVPMLLNTSFNRKGQPIVETPADALSTFLSCRGSIEALFINNWEVRVKPFPLEATGLAALASAPSASEAELPVVATPFYLSEVVATPLEPEKPTRVRIQTGTGETEDGCGWKVLPSTLHLELLQLLQRGPDSEYDVAEELGDVYEALKIIREEKVTWQEVKDALRWLYSEGLLYFKEEGAEESNNKETTTSSERSIKNSNASIEEDKSDDESDIDFDALFKDEGVDIVDMRFPY